MTTRVTGLVLGKLLTGRIKCLNQTLTHTTLHPNSLKIHRVNTLALQTLLSNTPHNADRTQHNAPQQQQRRPRPLSLPSLFSPLGHPLSRGQVQVRSVPQAAVMLRAAANAPQTDNQRAPSSRNAPRHAEHLLTLFFSPASPPPPTNQPSLHNTKQRAAAAAERAP